MLSTTGAVEHLIVGEAAPGTIGMLSQRLRRATLAAARAADKHHYAAYSPWLCVRPRIATSLVGETLIKARYRRHRIVTRQPYMHLVSEFLARHFAGELSTLIGSSEDWALCQDVETERPDYVPTLDGIIDALRRRSPFFDAVFPSLIELIVPLREPRPRGWSLQAARGVIFLGFPPGYSRTDLTLDVVHELGHQALGLIQSIDPIFTSDFMAPIYSEVRHVERPAIQSFHAAAAIAFMHRYLVDIDRPDHIHPDFTVPMHVALGRTIATLRAKATLTPIGGRLLDEFESLLN